MQRHRKATRATRSSTTPKVDANTRHVAVATRLNYRDKSATLPLDHPSNKPRTVSASLAIPASDRSSACTVWRLSQWLKLRPSERLYCGS